ncbi:MAG: TorF family putative porin [Thermodesulfobacteriota bacterium]|nr:TorF family putative porin [Thermodesulfobacteriota bacterium]
MIKENRLIRNTLTVVAALILATSFILPASAEEEAPSADLSVAVLSAYIWRGAEFSKDSIVIQPSMTVGYKGFSANVWGNLDTDPHESLGVEMNTWNETDFTVAYGMDFGSLSTELGYIYYGLEAADDSQELYLSLGLDTLLSPTLTIYRDFAQYPGWYLLLGISHALELKDNIALELAGSVSYLSVDEDEFDDSFHDATISASLPVTVTEYVTVTPSIAYVFPASSDAEDRMESASVEGDEKDFFYGGVTASFAF